MFYFKEFFYRLTYLMIGIILLFLYFYNVREYIFLVILSPLIHNKNLFLQNYETSFILNSPNQLIDIDISVCLILSYVFLLPFVYDSVLSFFKPAVNIIYAQKVNTYNKIFLLSFYLWNYFLCIQVFPYVWYFTEILNLFIMKSSSLSVEYEPNLLSYMSSLFLCFKFVNFLFFMLIFLIILINNFKFIDYFKSKKLLKLIYIFLATSVFSFFFDITVISLLYLFILLLVLNFFKTLLYFTYIFKYVENFYFNYEIKKVN